MRFPAKLSDPAMRIERALLYLGIGFIILGIVLALAGCQTYAAVTKAPPDFWATAEGIVVAFIADIGSVLKWFF